MSGTHRPDDLSDAANMHPLPVWDQLKHHLRPSTLAVTHRWFVRFATFAGGDQLPTEPRTVEAFVATLRQQGCGEASLASAVTALRRLYRAAYHTMLVAADPLREGDVRIHRASRVPLPGLDESELRALFARFADSPEMSALLGVLLLGGARLPEAMSLDWHDAISTPYLRLTGRTGVRHMPRCNTLTELLARWRSCTSFHPELPVFQVRATAARRRLSKAGVSHVLQLRRSMVSALLVEWPQGGIPIETARAWLGYSERPMFGGHWNADDEAAVFTKCIEMLDAWSVTFLADREPKDGLR